MDKFDNLEKSFKNYRNVKKDKKENLMGEREKYLQAQRTLMVIMLAIAQDYRELYPGASGSVLARIKSFNSLSTKIDNEFASVQALKGATQKDILEKIKNTELKDIFATSVITEGVPRKFTTGNDELDKFFSVKLNNVINSENRITEHKAFTQNNMEVLLEKENEKRKLEDEYENARTNAEIETELKRVEEKIESLIENKEITVEQFKLYMYQRDKLKSEKSKEELKQKIEEINSEISLHRVNSDYGETNLVRTENVHQEELAELQYEMSSYYARTANQKSNLSFLNTTPIKEPKPMKKANGFRAMNTGYAIEEDGEKLVKFEIQGKGKIDYNKAEFGDGAEYHENQKTAEGQRSKRNDMPDFTIIGEKETDKIESEVRKKYADKDVLEMLEKDKDKKEFLESIEDYRNRLLNAEETENKEKLEELYGVTYLGPEFIEELVKKQYEEKKEKIIQDEIEKRIFMRIIDKASSEEYKKEIENSEKLKQDFQTIKIGIINKHKIRVDRVDERIDIEARAKLLFKQKSDEILEFYKYNVPVFFEATIPREADKSPIVYKLTPGECIYRNYYNRLKGLKLSDGTVVYEPKKQQEKALFKLADLFKEEDSYLLDINLEEEEEEIK